MRSVSFRLLLFLFLVSLSLSFSYTLLFYRCLPPLKRWPRAACRGSPEASTTRRISSTTPSSNPAAPASFDPRGRGALLGFLMRAVNNRFREVRKARRRPESDTPLDTQPDSAPSPLQWAILRQGMSRYRTALATLSAGDQDIIRPASSGRSYEESPT